MTLICETFNKPILVATARTAPHADASSLVPRPPSGGGSGNETGQIYAVATFPFIRAHSSAPPRFKKRHVALKVAYLGWDYSGLAIQETVENTIEVRETDSILTLILIPSILGMGSIIKKFTRVAAVVLMSLTTHP